MVVGLRNYPRTEFMARNLLGLRFEVAEPKGGSRHDQDQTQAPNETEVQTIGDHLGGPRCPVGEDPPYPREVLAQEADGPQDRQLAGRTQWDYLPNAHRLPMGTAPPQVRPQEHRPRLVPTLVPRRCHGTNLGRPCQGVRRVGRRGLEVAECRWLAGQGSVRGGKRWGKTPPIAGKWAPRSRCWSMGRVGRWGSCWPGPTSWSDGCCAGRSKPSWSSVPNRRPRSPRTYPWTGVTITPQAGTRPPKRSTSRTFTKAARW